MERIPELIARILEWRTQVPKLGVVDLGERWDWSDRQVAYNAGLCKQAGFVEYADHCFNEDDSMIVFVGQVTWAGQEELARLELRAAQIDGDAGAAAS